VGKGGIQGGDLGSEGGYSGLCSCLGCQTMENFISVGPERSCVLSYCGNKQASPVCLLRESARAAHISVVGLSPFVTKMTK
jgi:hypothetical protein